MVKYFSELEHPNDNYLDLVFYEKDFDAKDRIPSKIDLPISEEYLKKIIVLINKIKSYNLLNDNHLKIKPVYLDESKQTWDYNMLYYMYINFHDTKDSNLTEVGINLLDALKDSYEKTYKGLDFVHDFEKYYYTLMDYLKFFSHYKAIYDECYGEYTGSRFNGGIIEDKYDIKTYLYVSYKMARYQNKVTAEDKKLFEDIFDYFKNNHYVIKKKKFVPYKYHLPNAWYITPYGHLYNTTGKGGHGFSTLKHPFMFLCDNYETYDNDKSLKSNFINCGYSNLHEAQETLKEGFIKYSDWYHYTHLIPSFVSIKPLEYENMSDKDKSFYDWMGRRTYNPKIVKFVAGMMSANAGLLTKYQYLREHSNDYKRDFEYLLDLGWDSILIRFCGFHKISSVVDKTITTSDINWQEDFKEYIDRGWIIDFVKPVVLNNGKLEEISDEYVKTITFHK